MRNYQREAALKAPLPTLQQMSENQVVQQQHVIQAAPWAAMLSPSSTATTAGQTALASRITAAHSGTVQRSLLQLQRRYGNQYVQRMVALSREGEGANEAPPAVEHRIQQARGSGQALESGTRGQMESAFGANFSGVRVHTGGEADMLNRALSARAFTTGQDIFFRQGEYSLGSTNGRELLAHELTHVVQQCGIQPKFTLSTPGDAYEQEADKMARAVMDYEQQRPKEQARTQQVQRQMTEDEGKEKEETPLLRKLMDGHKANGIQPLQRRLVTFGTIPDVNALLGLLGPPSGLTLNLNATTNQVQIAAVLPVAPPSAALRTQLTTIINHATRHAEIIVARGQPQVIVGAFPQPSDLTITRVQQVDIDDILAIEAGAPGNGVAVAAHEIEENFRAHGLPAVAGRDRFRQTHTQAVGIENAVAGQLVGPGRRVAETSVATGPTTSTIVFDYENYYLVFTLSFTAATQDQRVTSSRRAAPVVVSTRTIDNFASGSATIPAAAAGIVAAAAADVAANPTATVLIEGFADAGGGAAANQQTSQRRARRVQTALTGAGVANTRTHIEGRGAVNFVAPNNSAANRALNRRVVITVRRPGP